ncbi:hypothetical protein RJ639_045819 [Escallonia herrerae]|uniref:Uncharacterized protein n=1 Tax=Escallonia herrerae TaxID=1293975 RepID=A0AA88WHG9_9ASTE|nr:hypothetical protein RJ639_045819 [Escallonia herrerae]
MNIPNNSEILLFYGKRAAGNGCDFTFRFSNLSDRVEGVLGKTYRPDYISPVKRGVPMPMTGGEDKYQTPSLNSPVCKACRFQRQAGIATL